MSAVVFGNTIVRIPALRSSLVALSIGWGGRRLGVRQHGQLPPQRAATSIRSHHLHQRCRSEPNPLKMGPSAARQSTSRRGQACTPVRGQSSVPIDRPAQLTVDHRPVRLRPPVLCGDPWWWVKNLLQRLVAQVFGKRPTRAGAARPTQAVVRRRRADRQARRDLAFGPPKGGEAMPIRRSPNGTRQTRPQAGRDRPEWVVAINRNACRNQSVSAVSISRCAQPRAALV
jgi:hypothetical protein